MQTQAAAQSVFKLPHYHSSLEPSFSISILLAIKSSADYFLNYCIYAFLPVPNFTVLFFATASSLCATSKKNKKQQQQKDSFKNE